MIQSNTTICRPPLRYHGGKWKLAPWIIQHMPEHRIYVEPFGGGGSVLLRKERAHAEVYNDSWRHVVNVFRVLREPAQAQRLAELIYLTPFARDEFMATGEDALAAADDPVERARLTILRSLAGFGSASINGKYATGFRANSNRSGTIPAHDWANYPAHIKSFTERLRGVVVENTDALACIQRHDGPQTLYYVDPPYVQATRNFKRGSAAYEHDMDDAQHDALADVLRSVKGMVLLSGYRCELYDRLYGDWECIERDHFADGARPRRECLWLNPACSRGQRQIEIEGIFE